MRNVLKNVCYDRCLFFFPFKTYKCKVTFSATVTLEHKNKGYTQNSSELPFQNKIFVLKNEPGSLNSCWLAVTHLHTLAHAASK